MTLQQYVKESGSMEKAAQRIGCSYQTVFKWIHKIKSPGYLAQSRLKQLGIEI